ncbi:MAG: ABC transporter ATP-binding protein [Hyphomonadaceae bacterium]|nr:ABC transporter ATP-binding protein [Hyphomonadaceae bacterium]
MTAILDRDLWTAFGRALDAPIRVRIIASLVLAAIVATSAALAPMFLAQLVDGLSGGEVGPGVVGLAGAYLAALSIGRLAGHVQSFYYAASDQALQRRVSELSFDRLIRLPMNFHLSANPGALMQTHSHALQGVRMVLSLACASLFPIVVQMAAILWVVGSHFDTKVWVVVSLTIVAYVCVFAWGVRRTSAPINWALQRQVETSGLLSEGLANVETIKNCTAEQRVGQSYARAARETEKGWKACSHRRFETGLATAAVFVTSVACSIWLGVEAVRNGQMSAGDFLLLTTYMLQIIGPLEMSGYAIRDLTQGAAYLSGWKDLLAQPTEPVTDEGLDSVGARLRNTAPTIEFDEVSVSYGAERRVLSHVSFSVPAGTTVAIVGATGEGKTSLLRVLQKHLSPDAGRVLIDGAPLSELATSLVRRRIAVVAQEGTFFNASLRHNLVFAKPDASNEDIARVLRIARLDGLFAGLRDGLDTVVGDKGFKLSGGERQRVAIARALLQDADILLLDEATSALDARTEKDVCTDLMAMAAGRTTLIVTHRLALAASAASIIVLQNGRVVEQGSHDELMAANGVYGRLWDTQRDS